MKCQILFSRKNKKDISKCCPLKFLPSMQSIKQMFWIILAKALLMIIKNICFHGETRKYNLWLKKKYLIWGTGA